MLTFKFHFFVMSGTKLPLYSFFESRALLLCSEDKPLLRINDYSSLETEIDKNL